MIEDPGLQQSVVTLITMEKVLNPMDQRILQLRGEIEANRKALSKRRDTHHAECGRISKELAILTQPLIREYVEELSDLGQRPKLSREILEKKYDGFLKKTTLTVATNEKLIRQIRDLTKKAMGKIQSMTLSPISEIWSEFSRLKREIEGIDWHTTEQIKVDEAEFFKFSPPQEIDPNYAGPLSGLKF